ncbi:MAG: hypothetical protein SGILL_001470 [Bacillariaceae sp.]
MVHARAVTEGALLLSQILPIFAQRGGQHYSALLGKLEDLGKKRTFLVPEGAVPPKFDRSTLVDSPVLECLRNLYLEKEAAANFVLFAPPSTGKTTGAVAMLKWVLEQFEPEEKPRALMISGPVVQPGYFRHMSAALGAEEGEAWFEPLCAALKADPSKPKRKKSLLIMDDFDSTGPDNCNIEFIKVFCKTLYAKQDYDRSSEIFVVVMTQKAEIANELCHMNNWKKIVPMPGSFVPPQGVQNNAPLPDPAWTGLRWKKEQLVDLLKGRFSKPVFKNFRQEDLDTIVDGDNPTLVTRRFKRLANAQKLATGGSAALILDKTKFKPLPEQADK